MDSREIGFRVDLQRAKVYWSYYTTIFLIAAIALAAGIVVIGLLHVAGSISLLVAVAAIAVLYVSNIGLFLVMAFIVWRHENRHLDELATYAKD